MEYISGGQCAFITTSYVVLVPLLELMLPCIGAKFSIIVLIAAVADLYGMYLLSGCAASTDCLLQIIHGGTGLAFIGSLLWSIEILVLEVGARNIDGVLLTLVLLVPVTITCTMAALIFESDQLVYPFESIRECWVYILWVGFTDMMGFVLCTLGQQIISSSYAAVFYTIEGSFV